jgi:hypothetical protein
MSVFEQNCLDFIAFALEIMKLSQKIPSNVEQNRLAQRKKIISLSRFFPHKISEEIPQKIEFLNTATTERYHYHYQML